MPLLDKVPMVINGKRITNHLWAVGEHGEVYCYRYDKEVILAHWLDKCSHCPYWAGTVQGLGVECAYGKGAPRAVSRK